MKASAKKVPAAKKPVAGPAAAKSGKAAAKTEVKAAKPKPAKAAAPKAEPMAPVKKVKAVAVKVAVVKKAAKAASAKPVAVKAASKPAPKPLAKAAAQPAEKSTIKPKKTPPVAAPAAPVPTAKKLVPSKPVAPPVATMPTEKSKPLTSPAAPADVPATPPKPVKTRASRLTGNNAPAAPVTPVVASTAAKASYTMPSAYAPLPPVSAPHPMPVKKDPKLANNWKTKSAEELVDAEVLSMPDAEYMNDKQMAFFRLKLVVLKRDILANAGETTEHLREETVVVPDPADRATIEEEHALELRTRDRERKLLKKIEQSIQRIDSGDYGYCDETGEAIGVGRLIARPTATLSLEAQQRRELKQKMFGD